MYLNSLFFICLTSLYSRFTTAETNSGDRIYNGVDAEKGEFPFMVSIFEKRKLKCGGTIFNRRAVLTAAHCVTYVDITDLSVISGSLNSTFDASAGQYRSVVAIHEHPYFDDYSAINDIAVIILSYDLEFTPEVQPVYLASKNEVSESKSAVAIGWGSIGNMPGTVLAPEILQKVCVPIISGNDCKKVHKKHVKQIQICAGNADKGGCPGDSGGPLVTQVGSCWKQIGITSYGVAEMCGAGPVVYTVPFRYLDWIEMAAGPAEGECYE